MSLQLEIISSLSSWSLHAPAQAFDLALFVLFSVLLLAGFYQCRREFGALNGRRAALLLSMTALGLVLPAVLRLRAAAEALPWAGAGAGMAAVPLLAALPIVIAGLWLGPASAGVVGLGSGLVYAASMGLGWPQALEGALFGMGLGFLLRQRRRGGLLTFLSQPMIATPLLTLLAWPVPSHAYISKLFVESAGGAIADSFVPVGFASFTSGLLVGGAVQVVLMAAVNTQPQALPARQPAQRRPRTLAGSTLTILLVMILAAAVVCVGAIRLILGNVLEVTADQVGLLLIVVAGVYTLLSIGTVVVVRIKLLPITQLAMTATEIAAGDLNAEVPLAPGRDDDVGRLGQAIRQMAIGMGTGLEELNRLVDVSQGISARSDLGQTLQTLLRGAVRGLSADQAGIYLIDAKGGTYFAGRVTREGGRPLAPAAEAQLRDVTSQVWRNAGDVLWPDEKILSEGAAREPVAGVGALAVLPMLREGRTMGALWVQWSAPRIFAKTDKHFLHALANLASIMVDSSHAYRSVDSERGRLAAIVKSTRDGILVTDARGRLQLANPAAEELLAFRLKDCVGKPLPAVFNDSRFYKMLSDLSRGNGPAAVEIERDDRQLYISASMITLQPEGAARPDTQRRPEPQGWVFVMRDVTDRKQLDAMKSDIIHTIAHSMKSPLTWVRGYASLMKTAGPVTDKQEEFIQKVLKGIDDLTQLIDDLLGLGEISNRVGLTMTPCQLVNIAAEVADGQRSYAEGRGLNLITDFPPNIPSVVGDPRWLRQAIRNLVDNAIKYTNAPGHIRVSVQDTPNSVIVVVSDTGIGISEADRRLIFEKFYRVRRKETLHVHGTGLGLALVKKIAEQHGGQVWVESTEGKGSDFYLSIPKDRPISEVLGEQETLVPADEPQAGAESGVFLGQPHDPGAESGLFL
jgi:PAS domain S-box-containing protein